MARKLVLRTVKLENTDFAYADMMLTILRHGQPNGLSLDEVLKAVDVVGPIEAAAEAEEDSVVLSDEQWATLKRKLDIFPFGIAHRVIAEFGLMVRNAPEIGTEAVKAGPRLTS